MLQWLKGLFGESETLPPPTCEDPSGWLRRPAPPETSAGDPTAVAPPCGRCSTATTRHVVSSWGSEEWLATPHVSDHWACGACSWIGPRALADETLSVGIAEACLAGLQGEEPLISGYHLLRIASLLPDAGMMARGAAVWTNVWAVEDLGEGRPALLEAYQQAVRAVLLHATTAAPEEMSPQDHRNLVKCLLDADEEDAARRELGRLRDRPDETPEMIEAVENFVDFSGHLYERGTRRINPFMILTDRERRDPKGPEGALLQRGIADLELYADRVPTSWPARWALGKAYQAMEDGDRALEWFSAAFEAGGNENPDVSREYALELMTLGRGTEAVTVCETACKISPDDAGLVSNLALAQLIAGQVPEAQETIARALAMAPGDPITQAAQGLIEDVAAGRKLPMTRLPRNA